MERNHSATVLCSQHDHQGSDCKSLVIKRKKKPSSELLKGFQNNKGIEVKGGNEHCCWEQVRQNNVACMKNLDEVLNFHYIGEEEGEEYESRSFMLGDIDDMEVLSVNDQHQYLKELSSSRDSNRSKSSKSNRFGMSLSNDSIPLPHMKKHTNEEIDSNIQSSEEDNQYYLSEKSVHSSQESNPSFSRKLKRKNVEKYVSRNSRPARIAEYIKRFRTEPPTKRSERRGLDYFLEGNLSKCKRSDYGLEAKYEKQLSKSIEKSERFKKQKDEFSYIDAIEFEINSRPNFCTENYKEGLGNLDKILTRLSIDEMIDMTNRSNQNDLDAKFRKGILSRLQSIGMHESYLDPDCYDILGEQHGLEECNAVRRVEELIKERNMAQKLLEDSDPLHKHKQEHPVSSCNGDCILSKQPINQMVGSENTIISQTEVDIELNDDNNELFTNDFICKSLRLKIEQLKEGVSNLERKYDLLE